MRAVRYFVRLRIIIRLYYDTLYGSLQYGRSGAEVLSLHSNFIYGNCFKISLFDLYAILKVYAGNKMISLPDISSFSSQTRAKLNHT